MTGAIAKRYARALAAVAQERGRLEQTGAELDQIAAWLEDPELAHALSAPTFGATARKALLGQMTEALGVSDLVKNFLGLLAEKGRLAQFRAIARAYEAMVDQACGRVRATLRSPKPISDASLGAVVAALEKIARKKVVPRVEIDPTLLGGLTVEMEGRVYDGSVRTQLAHLAHEMAREGAHD